MFKKKSMETVLQEIYEAYPDAFADGRRLSGLFADFSGGQLRAQKNQLDIFLKCGGNTRILALRDEAPRIQQREYHRLVGEMMDSYGMQQECALEISSIFWKTALGTQAPAMGGQEQKEKPAKKPLGTQAPAMGGQEKNEKPAKKPSEKQPRGQRIKGLLMLFGKMSGFARLMFAVGAYGVIACTIRLVQVMITEGFANYIWILYLFVGIYLLDVGAKVYFMLPGEFSRIVWVLPDSVCAVFDAVCGIVSVLEPLCPSPLLITDSSSTSAGIGVIACWLYTIVWLVRLLKYTKNNGPMWQ